MVFFDPEVSYRPGKTYPKGQQGAENANQEGIKNPISSEFINPSHSINSYKSYLRENLVNNIRESNIRKFLSDLEAKKRIRSLYNTLAFMNELENLENQYLRLRNQISFIPFYLSLKDRINEYAEVSNESADHKKVLIFMYTAVMGKISSLRHFKNHISIIDLSEYLEIVQKNIHKLGELEKEISITEQTEEYQKSLMDKINSAIELVNSQVIPDMLQAFSPLAREISSLLVKVIKNREAAKKEVEELEAKAHLDVILGYFKFMASAIQFLGPEAKVIGIFIEQLLNVVEANQNHIENTLTQLLSGLDKYTKPMKDFLKGPFFLYCDQIEYMLTLLAREKHTYQLNNKIKETIEQYKIELNQHLQVDDYLNAIIVSGMRSNLAQMLKDTNGKEESSGIIKKLERVNKMAKLSFDVWSVIKESSEMVNQYSSQLEDAQRKFDKWDARVEQIEGKLIPMLLSVHVTMLNIVASLANKTSFELDITAWKIQSLMGDFKLLSRQMADETGLEDEIVRIIERIEEAFGALINIFNRIQSFMDQSKFAEFLSKIQSPNNKEIGNPVLKKVVTQSKKIIQSNLIMEQYEVAIHSFKQCFFPFATLHLVTFDLPTGLQSDDTEVLVRRASTEIDYLQDQVKLLEVSIGRFDREIFGGIDFRSNAAVPFYIFKSREFKVEFQKLLNGEEIMIKANIVKGLSQNALKFNEIGVQLKLVDDKMQRELDAQLENFGVRMTLIGHAYYKCGESFYYLSVDDNVVIEYSFKKHSNGKPIRYNEVYRKLSEGPYFLSPYATWKIKLIPIDEDIDETMQSARSRSVYQALAKFIKSSLNLELVGRGQYFRRNGILETEICTEEVGKYYEFDTSTSDVFKVRHLRQKYLF